MEEQLNLLLLFGVFLVNFVLYSKDLLVTALLLFVLLLAATFILAPSLT